MITDDTRSKIVRDRMCPDGISKPLSAIEQLAYLLSIKRLDRVYTPKAPVPGISPNRALFPPPSDTVPSAGSGNAAASPIARFLTV